MSAFYDNSITNLGRNLIAEMQLGAKFVPTKIVIGSGYMPTDKTTQTMTDVVEMVQELSLNKVQKTTDGNCIFGCVLSNSVAEREFYFRELALYAKVVYIKDGEKTESKEVLYSYGNAKENAELIPAYGTGNAVEKQLDLIVYIGNDTELQIQVESGIYVEVDEFQKTMQQLTDQIQTHAQKSTVSEEGVHGLRYFGNVLQAYIDGSWVVISAADMTKAVYDPNGKNTDIFAYADRAVAGVTSDQLGAMKKSVYDPTGKNTDVFAYAEQAALVFDSVNKTYYRWGVENGRLYLEEIAKEGGGA